MTGVRALVVGLAVWITGWSAQAMASQAEDLVMAPLPEIAEAIREGEVSAEDMVRAYLERIETIDRAGPTLRAVLSVNPNAIEDARALDAARAAGEMVGPLHGVPLLIKDNIETGDPLPTTAGSLALKDNRNDRDAPLVAGLRRAGAIILGKANLSEWANFRGARSISGWSALGGQVKNPHMLDRSPCGSSSGSGAAAAAGLAAGTVGTETNGSIICPSTANGVVGFKPTVGLVSQQHIVPISSTQDTAGPMTRTVRGAAMMLDAMATAAGDHDFTGALDADALKGRKIGVLRFSVGNHPGVQALFDEALKVLKGAGAELVEITEYEVPDGLWSNESTVLRAEFKATLNAYLGGVTDKVTTRTLADVIAFNRENEETELALFGQETFVAAEKQPPLDDEGYQAALQGILTGTRENGIDKLLAENGVDILVAPSFQPAFLIDTINGDSYNGGIGAGWMAAMAGYPHLSVPMGTVRRLPVGLSFIGTAGDDADILAAGHAYEMRSTARVEPEFLPSANAVPEIAKATRP